MLAQVLCGCGPADLSYVLVHISTAALVVRWPGDLMALRTGLQGDWGLCHCGSQ